MSTAELLEQVKKLSEPERDLFIEEVLALDAEPRKKKGKPPVFVPWPDIEERAKKIFGDQIFDNLILEERASRDF